MTREELREILVQGGKLRHQARISVRTISKALGLRQALIYSWDHTRYPSSKYYCDALRYARVLKGIKRHLEIEES